MADDATRDFLWVCLAETVRRVSNSRLSTCKLHVRPLHDVRRPLAAIDEFEDIAEQFAARLAQYRRDLPDGAVGTCRPARLVCADVRTAPRTTLSRRGFDLVVTSPPYGDNHTTVSYGQASYLPLRWIPASELARITGSRHPETAYETDTASLGGSMKSSPGRPAPESETLAITLQHLSQCPADRAKRVQRFVADLDHCIERVVDASAPGAIHVWTVGDRHVGGRRVPLCKIFCELAASRGLEQVGAISRTLPSQRRMAARNRHAPRIAAETSLAFVLPRNR